MRPIRSVIENPSGSHEGFIYGHLGNALVATGTPCSECLALGNAKGRPRIANISSLTSKSVYAGMSSSLNANAANLKTDHADEPAIQQNRGIFELID